MDDRAERLQRRLEAPLLAAALLTIPAIAIEQSDVGGPWDTVAAVLNWTIWATFAAEILIMLRVVSAAAAGYAITHSMLRSSC
jgi:hypothetical protein